MTLQTQSRSAGRSIDKRACTRHVRCGGSGWYMQGQSPETCSCTEATHFVLPRGTNSMVKVRSFFEYQRGHVEDWGEMWLPVRVDIGDDPGKGIEAARELAAHMTPIDPMWKTLSPHLDVDDALEPWREAYKACRGKWRHPFA